MSAVRLPALQRLMCRLMWREAAQRQGPAVALAGAEVGPVAHREPSAFELPDMSIVFAVPKSKVRAVPRAPALAAGPAPSRWARTSGGFASAACAALTRRPSARHGSAPRRASG